MVLVHRKTNWFHRQSKRQHVFLRRSWAESRNSLLAEPNFKEPIETRNHHKHQDFKILLHLWSASARHCCHRPTRPRPSSSLCRRPGAGEPLPSPRWTQQGEWFGARLPNQVSGSQQTLPKPETSALGLEGTTFHAHKSAWKRESAPGTQL